MYIEQGTLLAAPTDVALVKRITNSYSLFEETLYRRGLPIPLLKCIEKDGASYTIVEVH